MKEIQLDLGAYQAHEPTPGVGRWRYEKPLPLTTAGQLRVVAIGVGSAFARRNYQSNFIIIKGNTAVFVDIGTIAAIRMAELNVTPHQIKHLIVTHSHADHIGAIEELALKRRYEAPMIELQRVDGEPAEGFFARAAEARRSGKFRPCLYVPDLYARELWDMSLRGGLAFSEEVEFKGPEGGMRLEHFFQLVQPKMTEFDGVTSWVIEIGGIHIRTFLTKHVPDTAMAFPRGMYTTGLVIDHRLYISGDTRFDRPTIDRFGASCESLWHDCQHFPGGVHAFYGELKALPADLKQKMWLYHLSDGMLDIDVKKDGFADLLKPAPTAYDFE